MTREEFKEIAAIHGWREDSEWKGYYYHPDTTLVSVQLEDKYMKITFNDEYSLSRKITPERIKAFTTLFKI